ncbi:MAG TPA: zf-HC2 domain-containing protein [Thermoanaerobaculia bacterium]|jgi:mycothiol system anti-sigma-R factor|nr:zf-HC2 domain-containing protein [Thermoanaerobaculia bacterium]
MDCKRVCEAIYLFVDNELEEDLQAPFRAHVEDCPECAHRVGKARKVVILVRERCIRCCAPDHLRLKILTSMPHRRPAARPL